MCHELQWPLFSTSAAAMAFGALLFAIAALGLWLTYLPLREH